MQREKKYDFFRAVAFQSDGCVDGHWSYVIVSSINSCSTFAVVMSSLNYFNYNFSISSRSPTEQTCILFSLSQAKR